VFFFAEEVSSTEFRTRFLSAKAIDELAHFGKLFMRTVPGAIISLEKWYGDIESISIMHEAWFRIKGIPMKFRNKSTVFYAASLVGKPLALDKNFLRHFSYVRVKIGSQDLALVPNSRIDEIKKGFYEFPYTRELFDPTPLLVTKSVCLLILKTMRAIKVHQKGRELCCKSLMLAPNLLLPKSLAIHTLVTIGRTLFRYHPLQETKILVKGKCLKKIPPLMLVSWRESQTPLLLPLTNVPLFCLRYIERWLMRWLLCH
jgi:hypothetical protein